MAEGKWYTTIKCFRACFLAVLVILIIVGIVVYTETNLPSFIGIILIATPGVVVLTVVILAINNCCHDNFSHSLEINGLTDGLEFDDLEERFYYGDRHSRRHSYVSSVGNRQQQRHSLYDQQVSDVIDSIPDDVSDDDHEPEYSNSQNVHPNDTTIVDINNVDSNINPSVETQTVEINIEPDENGNSENLDNSNDHNSNSNTNNTNNGDENLPSYEDAISNCGDGESTLLKNIV